MVLYALIKTCAGTVMAEQYDPKDYYQPGKRRLETAALESAQNRGIELAALLADGDVTPLPDDVDRFLIEHAFGISNKPTGETRVAIAQELQNPPFNAEDARRIGGMVSSLVTTSQEAATRLALGDTFGAAIFGLGMPETEPPTDPQVPPQGDK